MPDVSTWHPCQCLGVIRFGGHIREIQELLALSKQPRPPDDPCDSDTYRTADPTYHVFVEPDGTITSVEAWESVTFRGVELLGLTVEELTSLLPGAWTWEGVGSTSPLVKYDDLDAMFWIEEDLVTSVTVGGLPYG